MSRTPDAPDKFRTVEPDLGPGLEDPRTIHPSPEGLFSNPGEPQRDIDSAEPEPPDCREDFSPDDNARGIVDPRTESVGPDI